MEFLDRTLLVLIGCSVMLNLICVGCAVAMFWAHLRTVREEIEGLKQNIEPNALWLRLRAAGKIR